MKQSNLFKRRLAARIRTTLGVSALVAASVICSVQSADAVDIGTLTSHTVIHSRHVPEAVRNGVALRVGTMDQSQHLKLAINLPHRNQADLDQLLKQLYDPQSPNFGKYLTTEEFTARFGPTQNDYDAVIAWAKSNGLNVIATTPNRRIVNVEGSVATINHALGIQLKTYQHPTEERTFFASDAEPMATGLNVAVQQIVGLDNFTLPHTHLHKSATAVPHAGGSGPSGEFLPSDMRAAYYGTGSLTGSGQCIGIFSFDGYLANDLTVFKNNTGMAFSTPVNNVLVAGYSGTCVNPSTGKAPCDDGEQILDIVNAIGMAPGISQVRFYEGDDDTSVLNSMATDSAKCMSLSSSWGWSPADASSDDPIFQQMAAQGQTFVNATGDSGQFNSSTYDFPSVDQYIIQVGGTDLTTASAGGAWSSETAWPDSGGGNFTGTPIPSWQQISGVINSSNGGSTTLRNAPDVAMEANFDNPTVSNGTFQTGYGGTSFAAPRWAGFIALANQQAVANGHSTVGFFATTLYNLGVSSNYASNFHDITSGNNKPTAGSGSGFNAVAGYDLVTGWGSPKAAFITTLAGGGGTGGNQPPVANFTFTTSGLTATFTDGSTDSDGTISSRSWNFGDSSTSTSTNPSHTYAAAGTYTVTETVTDNGGATNSTSKSVTVTTTTGNVLTNGVPVTGLAATTGNKLNYTMAVPAGATNLKFTISGGTGDADLYVKFGSAPTTSSYDCRPYVTGNSETCTITSIQAGTYYVMLNAYASFTGVTLTGSYTAPGSGGTPTANFTFTTSGLTATFTDSSTDAGGTIGSHSWNFGDSSTSTTTSPSHTYATAGTYSVSETVTDSVNGTSNTKTSSVTVTAASCGGTVLCNGVAVTGLSGSSGTLSGAYTFVVPAGATGISVAISGGSGDADLYVKLGSAPTLSSYTCRPYITGNNETCTLTGAGTYYIKLNAYATYSGVSLVGKYTP